MYQLSHLSLIGLLSGFLCLQGLYAQHSEHDHDHDSKLPLDISAVLATSAGTSSERDAVIESLHAGAHDPKRRGFTFQELELGLYGATHPFDGSNIELKGAAFAHLDEESAHVEEAYAQFENLPYGFELQAGLMLTRFGRINHRHGHAWSWIDQAVIASRIFGAEGMTAAGLRAAYTLPTSWYSSIHAGIQDAFDETMVSFGAPFGSHSHDGEHDEDLAGVGGRPLVERERTSLRDFAFLLRWENTLENIEGWEIGFGASFMTGPNATANNTRTTLFGADISLTSFGDDHREFALEAEFIYRDYQAGDYFDAGDPADPLDDISLNDDTLKDWGFYVQTRYWLNDAWSLGLRVDYADSKGLNYHAEDDEFESSEEDSLRNQRIRISPLVAWQPLDALRLRLQYNIDDAEHVEDVVHSVWLSFEWTFSTGDSEHTH